MSQLDQPHNPAPEQENAPQPDDKKPFASTRFAQLFGSALLGDTAAALVAVIIPLLVAGPLQGGPLAVSVAVATDDIGWLIAGPIVGVLVDRYGFKRLLIGADVVRFVSFGLIALLAQMQLLPFPLLVGLLVFKSISSVFFLVGSPNLLARTIRPNDLIKANSAFTFSQSLSLVAGPPLAGLLAALISIDFAFGVTALCYLGSAIFLTISLRGHHWRIESHPPAREKSFLSELAAGWKYLGARRDVLRMVLAGAQSNFSLAMQQAVLVIYLLALPGFNEAIVGFALGAAGAGGIVGAIFADKLSSRFGASRTVFWVVLLGMLVGALIPLTTSVPTIGFLIAGYVGITVATVVFSAITGAYRQRTIDPAILGRVTASSRFISWGIAPIGALVGGLIAHVSDTHTALVVSAVSFIATPFWLLGVKWLDDSEQPR